MNQNLIDKFIKYLLDGNNIESVKCAKQLIEEGFSKEKIIIEGIEEAMIKLDAKCTVEQFNLLEIMLTGRAVMEVMNNLYPEGQLPERTKGIVLVASLEGDVHDLGKNILKMVLSAKGYNVIDCGKDCSIQKLVDEAKKNIPLAIGVSGLITSIIPIVKQIRGILQSQGLNKVKVIAGGAALKQADSEQLNVDFVADTPFDLVNYLNKIQKGIQNE